LNEGFSMALAEALACGLPVVISEQCFFPEVVRAGAGKIVPLDPLVIAGELSNILQNPTLRANMSEAARRLVSEHYTWPRIAEKSVAIYTRILQR
jgi:glycosyltransferase involved in cell wall biosynthesis